MIKRTVEIEDDLQDIVDGAKEEVLDSIKEYLKENPECTDLDDWYQDSGADALHEIADSNTPIYYSKIDGLTSLYSDKFDEAYENAGLGDGMERNHKQVAIYCYIEQEIREYSNDLTKEFELKDGEFIKKSA